MKTFIQFLESSNYELLPYDMENDFEGIEERALQIALDGGISILSDKDLHSYLVEIKTNRIIGALWVSHNPHHYSFDLALDSGYQNMGLSKYLIEEAIREYKDQKEAYGDDLEMEVDVINPKLAHILKSKYGFSIIRHLSQNRVLMTI